jgi:hypothetical protein
VKQSRKDSIQFYMYARHGHAAWKATGGKSKISQHILKGGELLPERQQEQGQKAGTHPARHGFATEELQQVVDEQSSGHQHLTRRVLKLLARDSSQELAEGNWGHCWPHGCKATLRQLVRPPGVQLGWPTCGTAPDQINSIHLHMLTTDDL